MWATAGPRYWKALPPREAPTLLVAWGSGPGTVYRTGGMELVGQVPRRGLLYPGAKSLDHT